MREGRPHPGENELNRHRTLDELTSELVDRYSSTEHHVAEERRLGMEELSQLSTELQMFFEKFDGEHALLERYIKGSLDIEAGELDKLIEGLKKFYEEYLEVHG